MGAFLRSRSPRGGKKYALRSRRVQWLGPPSPSAGGAALSALGSHESDGGTVLCDEAVSGRGHRPKRAKWWSKAAMAAAEAASTIC